MLTHPIQYYAAWFRWIHQHCADIDLHVIYASVPSAPQQGVGFGRSFEWDTPLTEGYPCRVVREARPDDRFDAGHFYGLNVLEIGDAVREARPDVVVLFGWYSVTLVRALRTARAMKVPVLYHGDTNLQSAPRGWRRALWVGKTRRLLRLFDGYLSVGTRAAAFLRFFGMPDERIFFVPHAVDNDRFGAASALRREPARHAARQALGLPADAFVVLFCGKLEAKKRPLDLVAGLSAINARVHLAIAGSGPLESAVRNAAATAGVPVSFLGFVNQSEMPRVYAAADCLVLPSDHRETWGLVVNEALAAGLPCVIADSVGCAPDLGTAETGGTYATADPVEVPRLIGEAVQRVRAMAAAGHDYAGACAELASRHSFTAATAGLVRALRVNDQSSRAGKIAPRILACCGSMVLVGGLERMTFEILRVQRERGASIHSVVNWWDNARIVTLAENIGASWSTGYYLHRLTRRVGSPMAALRIASDVVRTSIGLLLDAAAFRPSHILVSDYISLIRNAPALALLRLTGRVVVLRLGNAPDQGRGYRWIWRYAVNPFVDRFVCNSPFTNRELAAHGIPKQKRTTIAHTPPTRAVASSAGFRDSRRLVYVGQIIPDKGLDILLEAIAILIASGHDVTLDVAGRIDGWVPPDHESFRAALVERAQQPDLRGRVRFLGYREDVPALLARAAIHCCPSRRELREGFGVVVIEAKRAGIPSVVFSSGNLPDLITHGEDGWICAEESAPSLAEGIERFLDPRVLKKAMAAASASASAFSRDRFEQSWTAVFAGDFS